MHPSLVVGLALAVTVLGSTQAARAQLLERASSAVRDEPQQSRDDRDDDRDDDQGSSSNDDEGQLRRGSRTVRGSGSDGSRPRSSGVSVWGAGRPYYRASVAPTYSGGEGEKVTTAPASDGLARTTTRIALEGGFVYPADPISVGRVGASFRFQTTFGLEIAARYSIFVEPRPAGTDSLVLGRIGLDWRIITEEVMQFRVGAAVRHFQDRFGGLFGADLEAGLDFFPVDPLILSFEANIGFVDSAMVVQARGAIGLLVDVFEIYLGYNYEGIFGSQNVDLGGPMLGLRFWM